MTHPGASIQTGQPKAHKSRQPSRPARLAAIEKQLRELIEEYENWLESLPESLSESQSADLLAETIDQLTEAADSIAEISLPKGFGRD